MYYAALIVIALVFIWRITAGFKKGMVQELISLIAMAAAGICVLLILGGGGKLPGEGNRAGDTDCRGSVCRVSGIPPCQYSLCFPETDFKASDRKRT